jgi:PAS domain S-box-containing protein
MVAGSVGIFSVMIGSFLAFSIPALLPLAIRLFTIHDPIHLSMGFMLLIFWLIMFLTAKRLNRDILSAISLKYENIDLISVLETEVETRKAGEAELKQQKDEIERRVEERTLELQEANAKLIREIEQRRRIAGQLQESQEKYRDLVENINYIIYSFDTQGILSYISPVVESIMGYAPGEIIGKSFFDFIHPEDLSFVTDRFMGVLSGKQAEAEYRVRFKSGEYRWIRSSSRIIYKNGQVMDIRGALMDISERKALEMERANLEAQLKQAQKMESIGTLAGGIAHDFNNILFMMIGNAELALEFTPKAAPVHDMLEDIKKAGLRAKDIIKQLMEFSRNANREIEPVGVIRVIDDAIKFLRSIIPANIEIQQQLPESEVTIRANPVQIHQVLMNLFSNAAQAMEETGGRIDIQVETRTLEEEISKGSFHLSPGEYFQIYISDTGPGIDPACLDRIFEPYFTTKPVGKGSGMGLAVVHGIVKAHAGAIFVESMLGKGTQFTLFFPVVKGTPHIQEPSREKTPRGQETILLVDDEENLVNMIRGMLERFGYGVAAFTDPVRALEVFRLEPDRFHLVISDMTMPRMTGEKLAEELRCIRKNIPIIITTGYSALMNAEKAQQLGFAALVMKPVEKDDLMTIVRKVLNDAGYSAI